MDNTELAGFIARVADDLAPSAVESASGLGYLLAGAKAIVDDEAVLRVMVTAVRMGNIASYLLAAATAQAQVMRIPIRHKLKTGRDMLRELPLAPAAVAKLARVADHLDDLPALAREVRDGDMSLDHADAMIRGIDHVQSRMGADGFERVHDEAATSLLTHARMDAPAQIVEKARELAHRFAPIDPPSLPPADSPMLNQASITRTDEGRVKVEADLDQHSGERLLTALDGLSKPIPAPDGGRDPRTTTQRAADALVAMVTKYLASPHRPIVGGVVPHITLTVSLPVLRPDSPLSRNGGSRVSRLGFTGSVSQAMAREVCCGDTEMSALIMADSVSLDAHRNQRLATGALRAALVARDSGCQFPGCGRPASWTEAHHIREWAQGGETVLSNMVLLCTLHHHTYIHAMGWKVKIGHDGHPWFRAPEGSDWIRWHHRRTLTLANAAAA